MSINLKDNTQDSLLYQLIAEKSETIPNNAKLKEIGKSLYRLNILNIKIDEFKSRYQKYAPNYLNGCKFLVNDAILQQFQADVIPCVTYPKADSEFDYQCSDSMKLSKMKSIPPLNVANKIKTALLDDFGFFEKIEITGPGFLNFKLNSCILTDYCRDIIVNGVKPPYIQSRKVVIDFSSPNFAKEMHVGHLRSTIIGDCIANIFEFLNFDVVRVNHVGDWGTQFGMLIAHLEDVYPDYDTRPPAISDLECFYKESKKRFDSDERFKQRAHMCVVALQTGSDVKVTNGWNFICEASRKSHRDIYQRFNIKLEERGESFYQSRMISLVDELTKKGTIINENGCKVIHVSGIKVPLIVVKSDGGFTYDTSDLATLKFRLHEEKGDWLIYVVDAGQREHFETLFAFARCAGWYDPSVKRVEHIGFGVVLGENNKKFKTRTGEVVKLSNLLDEGVVRSQAKLQEMGLGTKFNENELINISHSIAYSCIKYAELSHNLTSDYVFSYDKMLDDRGNTAVYLLYTYTRIRSIIRNSGVTQSQIIDHVQKNEIRIENEKELKLLRKLIHFPEIIYRITFEAYPHYLCDYIYDLSCTTTEYYDACRIITGNDRTVNMNRLAQIYSAQLILSQCFSLLGLKVLEQM